MSTDTIAAISTGNTNSGINIIRISGINAKKVIDKVFTNADKLSHQKIIYGKIQDKENNIILDEVLVSYFKAPNSYTGEDVCEINCHGGRRITNQILELLLKDKDIRMAEPGEFSKIAFLNGKMDLSKAEAIIDMINAKTKIQTDIAASQMEGSISEEIKNIKEELIEIIANIDVGIDYPEYEYEELDKGQILKKLNNNLKEIERLIDTYDKGKYIKEGINVGIIGATNSGKSSLMNILSRENRAIVTDIEGTTRDVIEEKVILENLELNLFDTAGIRDTEDIVENIGINKSIELINKMDIIFFVIDITKGIGKEEKKILELLKDKRYIVCLNKIDISCEKNISIPFKAPYIAQISAKTGEGIKQVEQILNEIFNKMEYSENEQKIVINERHKECLNNAKKNIIMAIKEININNSIDLIEINLKEALENIAQITGESASEEVINKLFEKFCLGK